MSTSSIGLSEQLHQYLLSVSAPPDPLWNELNTETLNAVGYNMQISREQAQFMNVLITLMGATTAIEIGTFTGYSAMTIARALPENGRLVACDISHEWTSIAQKYWKKANVEEKIDLKIAPAIDTLDKLIDDGQAETYDLAFIDADKSNYSNYYEKCLTLLRPGGLICVDNTLWGGSVANPQKNDADTVAIRELNQRMYDDKRVRSSLVPIGDGLHLGHKVA
jgi:predicted O-methyltransferase YrrM